MIQFHEGQEIEVWCFPDGEWEKAKIVNELRWPTGDGTYFIHSINNDPIGKYTVQFPDGTCAAFDETHIRAVLP